MDLLTGSSVRLGSLLTLLALIHSEVGLKTADWILFKQEKFKEILFLELLRVDF